MAKGKAGLFKPIEKWLKAARRHPHQEHVFHGSVNMRNPAEPRGTGFHHRFGGVGSDGARVQRDADGNELIKDVQPNGTYRAKVEVQGPDGQWRAKKAWSSFFPDNMSPQHVNDTLNEAFKNRDPLNPANPRTWTGTANGLDVEGFYDSAGKHWHSGWPVMPRG